MGSVEIQLQGLQEDTKVISNFLKKVFKEKTAIHLVSESREHIVRGYQDTWLYLRFDYDDSETDQTH